MNFIEQFFHVSPDGGSGVLELVIVLVFLVSPVVAAALRRRRARRS